jgi:hypothetical protein
MYLIDAVQLHIAAFIYYIVALLTMNKCYIYADEHAHTYIIYNIYIIYIYICNVHVQCNC